MRSILPRYDLTWHFAPSFSMLRKHYSRRADLLVRFTAASHANMVRLLPTRQSRRHLHGNFAAPVLYRFKNRNDGGGRSSTAFSPKSEWWRTSIDSSSICTTSFAIPKVGLFFRKHRKYSWN